MKRSIVLALILAAALAPLAAQDAAPKLSMWNRGVFNLYSSDGTTSLGPNWMGYGVAQGPYNSLSLDWASKLVTWSMTAEWDGDGKVYPIYLRDYSGSFNMFGGFMKLTAGKVFGVDEYRFRNFDYTGFSTRIANAETGFLVQIFPMKALSLGAFIPVPVLAQSAATTYSRPNFGIRWTAGDFAAVKVSLRLEPDASTGNRELAVGATLTAVPNLGLTIGYTYRDVTQENDLFIDGSYGMGPLVLNAFADGNFIAGVFVGGGKVNAEYSLPKTPFTFGSSAAYGNGDVWGNSGLDLNPYIRYSFGGSSVQTGVDVTYGTVWAYKVQFTYTVGF